MSADKQIIFYDIASAPPLRTYAVNPWKTRYALNFKKVTYRTEWVDLLDIASVRQKLGVPANRTLPDGSPYPTLPLIQDLSTGEVLGDTFEIALYLDRAYPAGPKLFRPGTTGLTAAFNASVDGIFTKYVALNDQMPFPPESKDKIMAMFAKRFGVTNFADLRMSNSARERMFGEFKNALGEFVKAYRHVGGTTDYVWRASGTEAAHTQTPGRKEVGPYLDGEEPVYADFIVGSWLAMASATMPPKDWQRVRTWHDGIWGKIHDALEPLREIH